MGTGRTFNKKPVSRPKKAPKERRRRVSVHKRRVMELGYTEAAVTQMTMQDLRNILRHPTRAAASA
jgi:hypothetical protein